MTEKIKPGWKSPGRAASRTAPGLGTSSRPQMAEAYDPGQREAPLVLGQGTKGPFYWLA